MARLGDVCVFFSGTGFPNVFQGRHSGKYPFYKVGDISKNVLLGNRELVACDNYIDDDIVKEIKGFILPPQTVVFAKIGEALRLNRRAITQNYCLIDNNAMGIKANNDVLDTLYFYYFMCNVDLQHYCESTTVPSVRKTRIAEIDIPLPPLDEQRKIAAVLDKISNLIAKRRQQLDKLDEMVQSRFVEMFGDPEINPMEWPTIAIGETVVKIESGWSGNGTQRERKPNEIAVLKVSSVTKGYFIPEECKVLDDQKNIKKYISPQRGDLLFSRANTKEMVGATAIIRKDYPNLILPDKLWKIRFFDTANVVYMKYILSSKTIRNKFSSASTGTSGSMYNVSMEKFKSIKIPLPGVREQNYFAIFVEKTEKIRISISRSLDKLETLKKALMQDYFG